MLIRWCIILGFIVTSTYAANHTLFKNCTDVPVCKRLRPTSQDNPFEISKLNPTISSNSATWDLTRKNDKKSFKLSIQLLEKSKVRLQMTEAHKDKNNKEILRYKLEDVLDKQPTPIKIGNQHDQDKKHITIKPDSTDENYSVTIYKEPFKVAFSYDEREEVVLDGTSLVMDYDAENGIKDIGFTVQFNGANKLYGLHHHAHDLELPDTSKMEPFRLRNSDNANFEANSPMALYGSVPVIYGHSKDSTAGIFLHNAAEQWVDISYKDSNLPSAHFMVDSGSFDLFVMLGPTTKDVVRQFTDLTGKAHMPQLWTLGYHQSRWSYYSKEEVLEVVKQMKENDFPLDAIWLDIDYTDNKKYFTWSKNFTGDDNRGVENMLKTLGNDGRKLVAIIDPHIKVDDNYTVYKEGQKGSYFVKDNTDKDFVGECWPGDSSYVDFLNPKARDYYASQYSKKDFHHGHPEVLAGIWNDMNEPSVFDYDNEWTMPFNLMHKSKSDGEFDVEHRDIHNIYGLLHTMSTHDGLMKRDKNGTRPFILTRSHFAGSQRFAAMWTGDNTADWPYLRNSYSECMLSNLMGHVFCGADIPGFFRNPEPEFAYRAYQAGIWLPFFRGHAHQDTKPREPYRYDKEVQNIIRNAMRMRYKHIPTWYTLFYEHTLTGAPVIRPLFYHYPGSVNRNDHIMLGRDILARPVFEQGSKSLEVHFPGDQDEFWYRIDDESSKTTSAGKSMEIKVDANTSPVFYRSGSIIVRQDRVVSSTAEAEQLRLISIYINCDKDKSASGTFYHDDGFSFNYQKGNGNKHLYAKLSYTEKDGLKFEMPKDDTDQDHEGLEVIVDKIVYNELQAPGTYKSTLHKTDEDGNLFTNIDIVQALRSNKEVMLKLRK